PSTRSSSCSRATPGRSASRVMPVSSSSTSTLGTTARSGSREAAWRAGSFLSCSRTSVVVMVRFLLETSLHGDATRLGRFAARNAHAQHAVAIARLDARGVRVLRQADGPAEAAGEPLARVDGCAFTLGRDRGTLAGDRQHPAIHVDLDRGG